MNCVIEGLEKTIEGECDPTLYETPYKGDGYDPDWISCSVMREGYIYCFHPNQGYENGNADAKKPYQEVTELPKELPKAGSNTIGFSLLLTIVIFGIYIIYKIKR